MNNRRRPRQRRESIKDHLESARAFLPEIAGSRKTASIRFVRSLAAIGLIDGPSRVKTESGKGWGQRFAPRDYRALLEILLLRSRDLVHPRSWRVLLWTRGRNYPIETIREALLAETAAMLESSRQQVTPTGRTVRPFADLFRTRIADKDADPRLPDFGPLAPLIGAIILRPHEVGSVEISAKDIAQVLATAIEIDEEAAYAFVEELLANPAAKLEETINRFLAVVPKGPAHTLASLMGQIPQIEQPLAHLLGMLDDGFGRAGIETALQDADNPTLMRARSEIRDIRRGNFRRDLIAARFTPKLILSS